MIGGGLSVLAAVPVGAYLDRTHTYHGLLGCDLLAHYDFRMTACERFALLPV